jgi:hypothetical protein
LMPRMDEIAVGFGCVLIDDHRDSAYVEAVRRRAHCEPIACRLPS